MQLGDGRADAAELLERGAANFSREHHVFDMGARGAEAGTVVSAVMLGAIAGSGLLPFARERLRSGGARRRRHSGARGQPARLRAAFDARGSAACAGGLSSSGCSAAMPPAAPRRCASPASAGRRRCSSSRQPCTRCSALGHAPRARLPGPGLCRALPAAPGAGAATPSVPATRTAPTALRPRARWRAGWRCGWRSTTSCGWPTQEPGRALARACAARSSAGDDDLLKVYDHFKPGVPEFAALLPPPLARRAAALGPRARRASGEQPWALPLKVGSHTRVRHAALRAAGRR